MIQSQRKKILELLKQNNDALEKEELLKKYKNRLNTLIKSTKKLYDGYSELFLDEYTYKILLSEYQSEQKELINKISKLESEIASSNKIEETLLQYKTKALRYINVIEITKELVNALVSKIEIGYKNNENGEKMRVIKIVYKFNDIS